MLQIGTLKLGSHSMNTKRPRMTVNSRIGSIKRIIDNRRYAKSQMKKTAYYDVCLCLKYCNFALRLSV
jgi:hypothetical protein